jgi:hypothetical protein
VLVSIEPSVTLFGIGVAYVASGPIEWFWRWRTGKQLEELPLATSAESMKDLSHEH